MRNAKKHILLTLTLLASVFGAYAQEPDTAKRLDEVTIGARRVTGVSRLGGAENGQQIGQDELFRAACCNLGESFVANPSVDVNYSDAAVGARQIKLLGLSGQYVQMLLEGLHMAGGALTPYLLDFVPGAWMSSISVSKGTSSVKQGYQSLTGQIDVEYVKPDEDPGLMVNLYGDSRLKAEANVVGNIHLNRYLSTELLANYANDFMHHDANGDNWHDSPAIKLMQLQNRWKYKRGRYIMHVGFGLLDNNRQGGQMGSAYNRYETNVELERRDAYMKHAFLLNREHNTNIAFTATAAHYSLGAAFGDKLFGTYHLGTTSQLIFEHDFNDVHSLSTGIGCNYDDIKSFDAYGGGIWQEVVPGAYAQYTFKPSYKFTLMAGFRADRFDLRSDKVSVPADPSWRQRWYFTPRLHLKWMTSDWLTLRASVGKGFRPVHPLAENHYLLASGRALKTSHVIIPEEAWNGGLSAAVYIPAGDRNVTLNAEYYYTHFIHQAVVDYDSDPTAITIADLDGRSFSHTAQVDASYDITEDLNVLAAFRYNHVRCTYGGRLMEKPLQSRYKGLLTASWKPMMALWQVDVTLQLNGPGRMPEPYTLADGTLSWERDFPAYPQLNMQITREFRRFSVYVGAENITGYKQPNPIINADNPWSSTFEPTMIWGPVHGTMFYAGIRMKFWKL